MSAQTPPRVPMPPPAPLWARAIITPILVICFLAAHVIGGIALFAIWTTILGWLGLPNTGHWEWPIH